MGTIEIVVEGKPEPGGSKTAMPLPNRRWHPGMPKAMRFLHDGSGRPLFNVVDANPRAAKWKKRVAEAAGEQYQGPLLDGPLVVEMIFLVHRNKGHYGTGSRSRVLKALAPLFPMVRPDVLKLARPTEDALTGVVWTDDERTVDLVLRKRYVEGYCIEGMSGPRVVVRVTQHKFATLGEVAADAQQEMAMT